jgi:hypothetical protein
MKDPKALIALSLSIPAIGLSMFGCVYVLHMFWLIYPNRLALGHFYWPAIVLITACVPLFGAMILHLIRQLRHCAGRPLT